jgi:hypothetical protein
VNQTGSATRSLQIPKQPPNRPFSAKSHRFFAARRIFLDFWQLLPAFVALLIRAARLPPYPDVDICTPGFAARERKT